MSAEPPSRAWRAVDVAIGALALAQAAVAAWVTATRLGMRQLDAQLFDYAWQLELAWRAAHGQWSGLDFQYPRGPLWQLLALGAGLLEPMAPGPALAILELSFRVAAMASAALIALRWTRPGPRRSALLLGLIALSHGAGIATVRGLLTALLVLLAVDALLSARRARASIGWAALVFTAGALVSIDRALLGGLCVVAAALSALAVGGAPRRTVARRAVGLLAACAGAVGAVALLAWALGASPLEYLLAQRRFAAAYGANLATPWREVVAPANVIALILAASGVALAGLRRPGPATCWIVGALPAALFGVVQSDAGHVYLAVLPLVVAILITALATPPPEARLGPVARGMAGLLGAVFLLGWFGLHPKALALSPRPFVELAQPAERAGDRFETDVLHTLRYARERAAVDRCLGVQPGLTVVHALADVDGPTVLGLRWSRPQQAELARAIEEARCPRYVYRVHSFDWRGSGWAFGEDFLAIARSYAPERRLGPAVWALSRRDAPRRLEARVLPGAGAPRTVMSPGATLHVDLGEPVASEALVELDATLDVSPLRAALGGTPRLEYRFTRDGAPIHDWRLVFQLEVGARGRITLAADPDGAERRWITGEPSRTPTTADGVELRAVPLGRLSDPAAALTVHGASVRPPPPAARDESPERCDGEVSLSAAMAAGEGFARHLHPRSTEHVVFVQPTAPPEPAAEVFFPIRPCALSCFHAEVGLRPDEDGDGARFVFDAIDAGARPHLGALHVPSGARVPFELPLGGFAGQRLLLRVQAHGGDDPSDEPYLEVPRVGQCTARTHLAYVLSRGYATVERGRAAAVGPDVEVSGGARVVYVMYALEETCLHLGWRAEAPVTITALARSEGLEHVVGRLEGATGEAEVSLRDYAWRRVTVGLEVDGAARLERPELRRCEGAR